LQPLAVLAAIVITGVINLVDYPEAIYLWKVHKFDLGVWVIAFVGTLFLGVEIGLAISVCISLLLIIYESAFPHTAVLGRLPGSTVYRNIKQYPLAERYDGIVIVRIDAPIYFANTDNIRSKLLKYEEVAEEELAGKGGGDVKFIILELSPVSYIDSSALHILQVMVGDYKARGIQIILTNPSVSVMEALVRSKVADHIGREHMFASMHDAAKWCLDRMDLIESSFNGENQSVQ
jgi:sulfate transporter 4